jgi:pimeloyl-ACP methyl ester carboxylesterase
MADCDGGELWYERRGSGERVLYCNGSGATLQSARPVLDGLAEQFDVVGFDHRGMGRSPLGDTDYTMADCATDVLGLLDHLGWDRCRLVGLSFGGMVAQEVAVTRPERIERLVLLSTSPGGAFSSYPLEQLAELSAHERASRSLLLADRRWTDEWFTTHPEDLEVVMRLAAGQSAEETDEQRRGRLAQLAARQGHDVLDRLDRVTCPTYVACGRFDDIAPVANAEQIARRVPDTQLSVFDGGHLFMFQDPAAWPEILEFLARPAG